MNNYAPATAYQICCSRLSLIICLVMIVSLLCISYEIKSLLAPTSVLLLFQLTIIIIEQNDVPHCTEEQNTVRSSTNEAK